MKKSIPPLESHADHEIEIRLSSKSIHSAYYRCIDCNKFVSWLSRSETNQALALGLIQEEPRKTRNNFFND